MKNPRQLLFDRHQAAQPDLDKVRQGVVSEHLKKSADMSEPISLVQRLWLELVLPARAIWAGIAATWLVILFLHGATTESDTSIAQKTSPDKTQIQMALREQRRIMAELYEDYTVAEKPKVAAPPPRSEVNFLVRFA